MLKNAGFVKSITAAIFYISILSGCATVPYVAPVSPKPPLDLPGIYHKIEKGQTLWRISRMYGVDLQELTRVNRITDNTSIEVGQRILIPNQLRSRVEVIKYAEGDDFIWPVRGRVVSSFGQTVNNMVNKGIRITPYESKDIAASRSGKVVFLSDNFAGLGKTIILDHGDGFFTVYALSSEVFVKPGDSVKRGSVIARITGSGRGGDLHFEIRKGHLPQNPIFYLP